MKHGKIFKKRLVPKVENASAQAALQAASALSGQNDTQGGPNTVLRVIVEHMVYPVTLDVLCQGTIAPHLEHYHAIYHDNLTSGGWEATRGSIHPPGNARKHSPPSSSLLIPDYPCAHYPQPCAHPHTLARSDKHHFDTFQALIQYPDVVTAQAAKLSLDGQNIYNSCCTLRIEYSKLSSLNVKYNNDKSRDYMNPNLPTGDPGLDATLALGGELIPQLLLAAQGGRHREQATARLPNPGAPGVLASPFAAMHGLGSPLTSPYGNSVGGLGAAGMPLAGFQLPGAAAASALGAAGIRLAGTMGATGCVLLVSNLNEEVCVYGDVQRVKILYNKKDSALIQMSEPHQAHLAMTHMDKLRVFGKQIRVMPSKHQTVQLPKEGQPDAGLTKDYSNSALHRFKKPGSKNYQNIYPPSSTLHLSNIP
uniref:Polypyrimidine tract-binding protein 2 n=1 Tax=Timema genevievae TaxID=629358 RepID=A0A7R9K111_TIMGE|nr:unnamed protein product [Timema genevievae]